MRRCASAMAGIWLLVGALAVPLSGQTCNQACYTNAGIVLVDSLGSDYQTYLDCISGARGQTAI